MKRKIASRKLKRECDLCTKSFKKGEVYYRDRNVFEFMGEVMAFEYRICPKCKYKEEDRNRRWEKHKEKCEHPIIDTIWTVIPGEDVVKEPDHDECMICGQWV